MDNLTTFTTAALFIFALVTAQNFIRYAKAKDLNGAAGIFLAWLLGFGVVLWGAHSGITEHLKLIQNADELGNLDTGSLLFLGLAVGSGGPVLTDFFKSRDNSDSQAKPKLVGG